MISIQGVAIAEILSNSYPRKRGLESLNQDLSNQIGLKMSYVIKVGDFNLNLIHDMI